MNLNASEALALLCDRLEAELVKRAKKADDEFEIGSLFGISLAVSRAHTLINEISVAQKESSRDAALHSHEDPVGENIDSTDREEADNGEADH